ncbi:MAG: hypothetical protein WCL47_05505 [Holophagaceae bacterium]
MRTSVSLTLLIGLCCPLHLCAAPPTSPARVATIPIQGRALQLIDQSLADLEAAFASDPQAPSVQRLRDETARNLGLLRQRVLAIPGLPAPALESFASGKPAAAPAPLPESVRAVGELNPVWELDRQTRGERWLFNLQLTPEDAKTVQAVLKIQAQVFGEITQPGARVFIQEKDAQIQRLAAQWKTFYESVTLQEYPWESLANGWFDVQRAITDIPTKQVKILHPVSGVVTFQGRQSSSGSPITGAEVLGLQWYDPWAGYKPTWGLGVLVTLKAEGERSSGLGLIASYRDFKFGYRQSRRLDGQKVDQAIISINLARYFDFTPSRALKQAVDKLQASKGN